VDSNTIKFFVNTINRERKAFHLPLCTTVSELKRKIVIETGHEVENFYLIINGKMAYDDQTLEFYGLQENQTISQISRIVG
jgi:hypothetical protein